MPLLDTAKKHFAKDENLEAAAREYAHLDNRIRYLVYGHTHEPKQVALRVVEGPALPKEHVYLNTGTWRTRFHKSRDDMSFISWKNLTYVVFYTKEEREMAIPTFETWTGTLKKI